MPLLTLEHSPAAYLLDFALYTLLCLGAAATLLVFSPNGAGYTLLFWVLAGLFFWSLLEYLLHRFMLHGVQPFLTWHLQHHQRPRALIASPIVLSLSLFLLLAALPAWWLIQPWPALALTLGIVSGYLVYSLMHHAVHHDMPTWIAKNSWLRERRFNHAMHHAEHHIAARGEPSKPCHFGVSSIFWDRVFGTDEIFQHRPAKG